MYLILPFIRLQGKIILYSLVVGTDLIEGGPLLRVILGGVVLLGKGGAIILLLMLARVMAGLVSRLRLPRLHLRVEGGEEGVVADTQTDPCMKIINRRIVLTMVGGFLTLSGT